MHLALISGEKNTTYQCLETQIRPAQVRQIYFIVKYSVSLVQKYLTFMHFNQKKLIKVTAYNIVTHNVKNV